MLLEPYRRFLEERERAGLRRSLRPMSAAGPGRVTTAGGRTLVNFASNDCLGLSQHPELIQRAHAFATHYGAGSGASRAVCGNLPLFAAIEEKVARGKGCEAALLFASGFQANATLLPALLARHILKSDPLLFTDHAIHASLHQGCAAAGARQLRFRHNDLNHLEALLAEHAATPGHRFVVTETLFGMDGDSPDLAGLHALKERFGFFLFLDDAHATGVLGPGGFGLSGVRPGLAELVMGTFSKALGGFGAYAACSGELVQYLIHAAAGFLYTTAPPPPVLGTMDAALDLLPSLTETRFRLLAQSAFLRDQLRQAGLDTGQSRAHIIPVLLGDPRRTMAVASALEEEGMLVAAIRPPTVPPGGSRLRLTLSAAHTDHEVARLARLLPGIVRNTP